MKKRSLQKEKKVLSLNIFILLSLCVCVCVSNLNFGKSQTSCMYPCSVGSFAQTRLNSSLVNKILKFYIACISDAVVTGTLTRFSLEPPKRVIDK